ncbi:hypothetical protein AB4156_03390 [Cupriavidus sp. 2MCAB6]|uniref:hypothetical protein n=1 Tax=Cupriavidus sp. 2MCAB6 TaxID=3232981 RepID=UPI003F90B11C
MSKEVCRAVVVVYRSSPASWFFAEVDGNDIYRFGPFESERIVSEILPVIYPADLQRETITAMIDCDDATLLCAARGNIAPPPPGPRANEKPQAQASVSSGSVWRAFFSRHIQGRMA